MQNQPQELKQWNTSPPISIDANKTYQAMLKTNKGEMTIELFAKETPVAVNNFVFLAREGFYDGVVFHRIIKNFMIQGGDPTGTGAGGPGYSFDDEPVISDYTRGTVAMANAGPNTNGSQFFIMHEDYSLPKQYVIFGKLVEGFDTLDKIASVAAQDNGRGELSAPVEEVVIESLEIQEY